MDNMKCLKNKKTGNIIRVSDVQARQMEGNQWSYVPKSDWKSQERPVKKEVKNEEA
jgi:hypothetical protein